MDSERLNLGETEEPEMLELEKVRGDDPNFTDSENKPLIAIPKDSEVIEEVSDNPDSEPPATKIPSYWVLEPESLHISYLGQVHTESQKMASVHANFTFFTFRIV